MHSSLKPQSLFNSAGLANWHGFPDSSTCIHNKVNNDSKSDILNLIMLNFFLHIMNNKVNNGRKSAILNMIELNFQGLSSLKQHILSYSNGQANWPGLPDNSSIKKATLVERCRS